MASSCSVATQTEKCSVRLSTEIVELLDVAIYSFACLSGLRSTDKVRGDPILKGVCALFGQLLACASDEVKKEFEAVTPTRLGNWMPGSEPTPKLLTWVSTRLKRAKSMQILKEMNNPVTPNLLLERKEIFNKHKNQAETRSFPRCWRCGRRCSYCRYMRRDKTIGNLRVE